MTPRSYSRATLTAAKRNRRSTTTTAASAIRVTFISSAPPVWVAWILRRVASRPRPARRGRVRPERAANRLLHARARARRSRTRARLDGRRPLRRRARESRPRRGGGRPRNRECKGKRHLVRLTRGVEEHERSEDERDPARYGERSVCRDERLRSEESRREGHQQEPRDGHRQDLKSVEAEDHRDRAER